MAVFKFMHVTWDAGDDACLSLHAFSVVVGMLCIKKKTFVLPN